MAQDYFAFRDSTADSVGSNILATMNEIKQTLATNRTAINNLKPEWVSVKSPCCLAMISVDVGLVSIALWLRWPASLCILHDFVEKTTVQKQVPRFFCESCHAAA